MEFTEYKCPVCDKQFKKGDDVVVCPECGTPHHRECYEKEGHCHFADKHGADFSFEKEQLEEARAFAKIMDGEEVVVSIKAGEGGRTFGSVSTKEIAAAYKQQCGKEIDKKKIQLPEAIKNFGVYEVSVKLHPKVTGKLKVKVTEAK